MKAAGVRVSRTVATKEVRQRQLIDATIAAIGRHGYAGTTLSHVAGGAGMSAGIVNFYFKSKEQLLAATLTALAEEYDTVWRHTVDSAGPSAAAALDASIDADFAPELFSIDKVTVWFAFWAEARSQPAYRAVVSKLEAGYFEETRALCAQLVEEGGYAGVDPSAVAGGLNAMIDGFWFDFLIEPDEFDVGWAKRTCRQFLAATFPNHFPRFGANAGKYPAVQTARTAVAQGPAADHRERLATALQTRMQPNTRLDAGELAQILGISPATLAGWLAGVAEPSSWEMGLLCGEFGPRFWQEVYGPIGERMRERLEAKAAAAREEEALDRAALRTLMGSEE
jgi:TetR/AcrR family transcriptional repressor of bet genes